MSSDDPRNVSSDLDTTTTMDETKQLKMEIEKLREDLHKQTLKLETQQKNHVTELEYMKEELEIEKDQHKQQIAKLHEEYKSRELIKDDKNAALNEELNALREEYEQNLQVCEKYRGQVDLLRNAKSAGAASSYSDYEGLKESQRILRGQLIEKDEILSVNAEKIARLDKEVGALTRVVQELNEIGESKDSAIKELGARIKELEREKDEETGALQNEVLMLKEELKRVSGQGKGEEGKGGGVSRGNSLFSEVDERRLKVETELQRLREKVKRLTAENQSLQLELERGDSHSATITTQLEVIAKSEHELAVEIKKDKSETLALFDCYRDRLDSLRNEYVRKLSNYKSNHNATHSSEVESIRQERDSLQLLKISMERENNELKRELKFNKHLRTHAEANLKILKAKLDFLKAANNEPAPQQTDPIEPISSPETDQNENPVANAYAKNESVMTPTRVTPKRNLITKHENPEKCRQQ